MQIYVYSKYDPNNPLLSTVSENFREFLLNPPSTSVNEPEYWFVLFQNETVLADCEVRQIAPDRYEILNVEVVSMYRGNEYCTFLLLNMMNHFYQETMNPHIQFELWTAKRNLSARKAYRKIFTIELEVGHYVYFSTDEVLNHYPVPWMHTD